MFLQPKSTINLVGILVPPGPNFAPEKAASISRLKVAEILVLQLETRYDLGRQVVAGQKVGWSQ